MSVGFSFKSPAALGPNKSLSVLEALKPGGDFSPLVVKSKMAWAAIGIFVLQVVATIILIATGY